VETGYPSASDRPFSQTTLDVNIDTANGTDHGFAYCFRDMYSHYLVKRDPDFQMRPADQRFFIDGQLVATLPNAIGVAPAAAIVEHDQYPWLRDFLPFPLTHELARCNDPRNDLRADRR
jgi:hypothetical protein